MHSVNKSLVNEQIASVQQEILLINFIFSLVSSLSLFLLGILFLSINSNETPTDETYVKFLQASGALFAPYLTIVAQGFYYPRWRKLNSLRHLLFKESINDDELNFINDK